MRVTIMTETLRVTAEPEPPRSISKLRLGLCCQFVEQPIHFRTTTATSLLRMKPTDRQLKLSRLCWRTLSHCCWRCSIAPIMTSARFRIGSSILPVKTHPQARILGRRVTGCRRNHRGVSPLRCIRRQARYPHSISSRSVCRAQFAARDVVEKSIEELEYQAEVAEWVRADVINIHGGGAYGDKSRGASRIRPQSRPVVRRGASRADRRERRQDLHAQRPVAALPSRGRAAGIRRASSPLLADG